MIWKSNINILASNKFLSTYILECYIVNTSHSFKFKFNIHGENHKGYKYI